jgi:hypothetical protein
MIKNEMNNYFILKYNLIGNNINLTLKILFLLNLLLL